jgi:predicted transcriptional regulator
VSRLDKIPEYLKNLNGITMTILKEAREAKNNPQSPNFIEAGIIERLRHLAIHVLEDIGFLAKSLESRDVYVITDKGEKALTEWEK